MNVVDAGDADAACAREVDAGGDDVADVDGVDGGGAADVYAAKYGSIDVS